MSAEYMSGGGRRQKQGGSSVTTLRWLDSLRFAEARKVPEDLRLVRALSKITCALDALRGSTVSDREEYAASLLAHAGALVVIERRRLTGMLDDRHHVFRRKSPDPSEPSLVVATWSLANAIDVWESMGEERLSKVVWNLRRSEANLRAWWREHRVLLV